MFLCRIVDQISASCFALLLSTWLSYAASIIFTANSLPLIFSVHLKTLANAPRPRKDLMSNLSVNELVFLLSSTSNFFSASFDAKQKQARKTDA